MTTTHYSTELEPLTTHHNLVCWKSSLGGLFIAIMSFMTATALGAGIGGLVGSSLISNEEGGTGLATAAGVWLGISCAVSLFLGSYYALRSSKFVTCRVGIAHGFLVASLFFVLLVWGLGSAIGGLSKGMGKMAGALANGSASLSNNPFVQDSVQKALGNSNLRSDPKEVVQGLTVRMLQGDTESAKNYLAYQTGLPPAEVDARIAQFKADFEAKAKIAAQKTSEAIAGAGWCLFVTFLVGLISAALGGHFGARANLEKPIARVEVTPYVAAAR